MPADYELEWWTTEYRAPNTKVNNPEEAGLGVYYAFFTQQDIDCENLMGVKVEVVGCADINLTKTGSYVDANEDQVVSPGDQIQYVFVVTKIGRASCGKQGWGNGWA